MIPESRFPIRRRLTLILMLTSGTVLVLASIGFVLQDYSSLRAGVVREASRSAEVLGASVADSLAAGDPDAAGELFATFPSAPHAIASCLYSPSGSLITGYVRHAPVAGECPDILVLDGHRFDGGLLHLAQDVFTNGRIVGRVYIQSDMRELRARMERYATMAGFLFLSCSVVAWVLSTRLQRLISDPIVRLSTAARDISHERDYSIRVEKKADDELGMLTDSFNEMLAQIQQRDEALKEAHRGLEARVEQRTRQLFDEATSRMKAETALSAKEEEFRQAQKMEAVGRLAGGVAHDFNNLLTAITCYSDLLLVDLKEGDPLRSKVQEIKKAGDRATSLTRQLLAFSRRQVLAPRVFSPNAVVSDMEKMLRRLIGEDIELVTVHDSSIGCVKADLGQFEQVVLNLAVNARDAMPKGGRLTIATAAQYLEEGALQGLPAGRYAVLSVEDTGCGMDEETRSRIFEPFYTTKEQGTGLGLSTVYGVVAQSGGQIAVQSEPGCGTTFRIYLPEAKETAEERSVMTASARPATGTETILLVEDEDLVRDLARTILISRGYKVLPAANGGEAVLLCEQYSGPIHLLVTDVVMPRMSGPDLLERLSPLRPEMKAIFMSGYTDASILRHSAIDPATPFIQKPFSTEQLASFIRRTLDGHSSPA